MCAVLVVGLPIAALSRGQGAVNIAFAVVLTAVALGMEVLFVRNLRQQLARRRSE